MWLDDIMPESTKKKKEDARKKKEEEAKMAEEVKLKAVLSEDNALKGYIKTALSIRRMRFLNY